MLSLLLSLLVAPVLDPAPAAEAPAPLTESAAGAAELWLVLPPVGTPLTPVVTVGLDFYDDGYLPYFGVVPSVPVFQFGLDVPLLGELSLMVTTVPVVAPSGSTQFSLRKGFFGQQSNKLPFLVL